ncbi:putative tail fiber protein/putative EPSdepolymerase [Pantoea phage LIMElight]|uniref:Putative tail fiber protein/putative EPSdepolymerase n=1 Tax=Pantoea phage LIMElight TaxID=881915 RepID=E1Y3V4_9CAUD|nr:EPS depolymerase [Pantoea phage LIMElight]CBW54806.1 putative tail fiber protein/putative EPSdepolymerase [Pantoea phage LIMElight]
MANSWQTETGKAGQVTINVNIPYLSRSDIYVYIAGTQKSFTWDSDTVVRLGTALVGGEEVLVMRRTAREKLRILFSEGAAFSRDNLDEQNMQFLYLSQELVEGRSIEGFYGDISMNTFRITHLGNPINDTDAANKLYVDEEVKEVNQRAVRVPESTVAVTPTVAGRKNKLLGFDSVGNPVSATPIEGSATELELDLQDIDGMSILGRVDSIATLRTIAPRQDKRFVSVQSYSAGWAATSKAPMGGGFFEYLANDTTTADDGGVTIVGLNGARWRRMISLDHVTVEHFGAMVDGVTDDAAAWMRMHNWSRTVDATFGPGIVLPPGTSAISALDTGTTEQPAFKLRGPEVAYGRIPRAYVKLLATDSAYAINTKARRMEVSNLYVNGAASTKGFFQNTVTRGDYCRIHAVQARGMTGRVFHVYDTIDTAVTQCYSSGGKASFFRTDWSNESPGAWDHPTAIYIADCNFESHTGEYAVSCIRAGQSSMRNTWFDRNERGFDISQGGWILENVTQENSVYPSATQYTKLVQIRNRFAQGKGIDPTVSGYDPSQDPSGKPPSWVNSGYENGTAEFNVLGFINSGSMSYGYESSQFKVSNMTANQVWIDVGSFTLDGATGESVVLKFVGAGHFDAATANPRPGGTNYGAGETTIMMQQKDSDAKSRASWYSHGASPIVAVRVATNKNRPHVYVQLAQYTGPVAMTVHTSAKSNFEGGQHFYQNVLMTEVTADAAAAAAPLVPATWNVSNGNYGLGMDMDTGRLSLDGPGLVASNASSHLPVQYNGSDVLLAVQPSPLSTRVQRVTKATLPKATENPYGVVLVTDAVTGNGVTQWRMAFCTGEAWFTADGQTNLGTGSVTK